MKEPSLHDMFIYEMLFFGGMMLLLTIGRTIFLKAKGLGIKTATLTRIKKLRKGELTRTQVARELDIPYYSLDKITPQKYTALTNYIREGIRIGDYNILYAGAVDAARFLVFTELEVKDSYIDSEGSRITSTEKFHHDFLLSYDPLKSALTSYSTLYEDTTDKFQKHEFLKKL